MVARDEACHHLVIFVGAYFHEKTFARVPNFERRVRGAEVEVAVGPDGGGMSVMEVETSGVRKGDRARWMVALVDVGRRHDAGMTVHCEWGGGAKYLSSVRGTGGVDDSELLVSFQSWVDEDSATVARRKACSEKKSCRTVVIVPKAGDHPGEPRKGDKDVIFSKCRHQLASGSRSFVYGRHDNAIFEYVIKPFYLLCSGSFKTSHRDDSEVQSTKMCHASLLKTI